MGSSTVLQLSQAAYRLANIDQDLTSFSMPEYPYNIALDLWKLVIGEMNRMGRYWFTESKLSMGDITGKSIFNLNSFGEIDPKGIKEIKLEKIGFYTTLTEISSKIFRKRFNVNSLAVGPPMRWCKYGSLIEFDTVSDKDYNANIYYFTDLPQVVSETDKLLCQTSDEDIFLEGVYAYLMKQMGLPGYQEAYTLYISKVSGLLANMKQDSGIPTRMPANF